MDIKKFTWNLKKELDIEKEIPICRLLEMVSHALGHKNWRTALATAPEINLEEVIDRLQKEKADMNVDLYERGELDGLKFAQNMSYRDLKSVIDKYETTDEFLQELRLQGLNIGEHSPCQNSILGDYFRDALKELPIGFKTSFIGGYKQSFPDESFRELENGFVSAIRDFWDENKSKF